MTKGNYSKAVKTDEDDSIPENVGRPSRNHSANSLVVERWENERMVEAKVFPYGWWIAVPEFASDGEKAVVLLRYADDVQKWKVTIKGDHETLMNLFLKVAQAKWEVVRCNGREVTELKIEKG